jgi:hypothetical protein
VPGPEGGETLERMTEDIYMNLAYIGTWLCAMTGFDWKPWKLLRSISFRFYYEVIVLGQSDEYEV